MKNFPHNHQPADGAWVFRGDLYVDPPSVPVSGPAAPTKNADSFLSELGIGEESAPLSPGDEYLNQLGFEEVPGHPKAEAAPVESGIGGEVLEQAGVEVDEASVDQAAEGAEGEKPTQAAEDKDENFEDQKPWAAITEKTSGGQQEGDSATEEGASIEARPQPRTGPLPPGSMRGTRQTVHEGSGIDPDAGPQGGVFFYS